MNRLRLVFLLCIAIALVLSGCMAKQIESENQLETSGKPAKLKVFTSFYPLYFFTSEIAGEKAEIINLTPAGAEPHDWEPTPRTIADMQAGHMFVYNGVEMEGWAEKVIDILDSSKTKIVFASSGIELIKLEEHDEEEEAEEDEDEHGEYDPHVWVSPVKGKQQAQNIYKALVEIDPDNKEFYKTNFDALIQKLDKLDKDIRDAIGSLKNNIIVTSHDAFGYFAHDYGLEQIAIRGVSPDDEPSPAKMAKLVEECREHNVKYIFFEKLVSPKLSETLAREIGAETLVLNAAHGLEDNEIKLGKSYITVMYENLENLKKALSE